MRYIGSSEEGAAGEGGAGDPVVRPTDAEFCRGEVAFPGEGCPQPAGVVAACHLCKADAGPLQAGTARFAKGWRIRPRLLLDHIATSTDGYPILLASEESLADLNTRLSSPLPMARFRPNVVVAGAPCAFAEDAWGRVRVAAPAPAAGGAAGGDAEGAAAAAGGEGGGVELEFVRPCDRCGLPSVDQEAGVKKEPNPLDTLSGYRWEAALSMRLTKVVQMTAMLWRECSAEVSVHTMGALATWRLRAPLHHHPLGPARSSAGRAPARRGRTPASSRPTASPRPRPAAPARCASAVRWRCWQSAPGRSERRED